MTFVIANWQEKFETAETRKLEHLKWCPAPNKLDGLGYRRMVQQRDRCNLFAAWNVLRAIASKTLPKECRGRIERDGRPLTAEDVALMSGFPAEIFTRALAFFVSPEMGWLLQDAGASGESPATLAGSPAVLKGMGWKGIEETTLPPIALRWSPSAGWEGVADADNKDWAEAFPACDISRQLNAMAAWLRANPAQAKKTNWRRFVVNWLKKEQDRGGDARSRGGARRNGAVQRKPLDPALVDLPDRFKAWAIETHPARRDEIAEWKTWADAPSAMRAQWWGDSKPDFLQAIV